MKNSCVCSRTGKYVTVIVFYVEIFAHLLDYLRMSREIKQMNISFEAASLLVSRGRKNFLNVFGKYLINSNN